MTQNTESADFFNQTFVSEIKISFFNEIFISNWEQLAEGYLCIHYELAWSATGFQSVGD